MTTAEACIRAVPLAPAGQRNVETLARHRRIDQHVRGIGRDALGAVRGDGVAELQMLGHIRCGQHDLATPRCTEPSRNHGPFGAHVKHPPPVAASRGLRDALENQVGAGAGIQLADRYV